MSYDSLSYVEMFIQKASQQVLTPSKSKDSLTGVRTANRKCVTFELEMGRLYVACSARRRIDDGRLNDIR